MALSPRQQYLARRAVPKAPTKSEYKIVDHSFRPDHKGELAGHRIYHKDGHKHVSMPERSARYWMDAGVIQSTAKPKEEAKAPQAIKANGHSE
jgi:hypothetical protein